MCGNCNPDWITLPQPSEFDVSCLCLSGHWKKDDRHSCLTPTCKYKVELFSLALLITLCI